MVSIEFTKDEFDRGILEIYVFEDPSKSKVVEIDEPNLSAIEVAEFIRLIDASNNNKILAEFKKISKP